MKLRTQLILAFLLLAVVPLSGLTLYSFLSSQSALRRAVEAESTEAARQMGQRMEAVSRDLGGRIDQLGELPASAWLSEGEEQGPLPTGTEQAYSLVLSALGESAGLIDSLEIAPPTTAPPPPTGSQPAPPQPPPPPNLVFMLTHDSNPPPAPGPESKGDGKSAPQPPSRPRVVRVEGRTLVLPPVPENFEAQVARQVRETIRDAQKNAEIQRRAVEAARRAQSQHPQAGDAGPEADAKHFNIVLGGPRHGQDFPGKGRVRAELNPDKVLQRVLGSPPAARMWRSVAAPGEIPFAVDPQGQLYTPRPEDLKRLLQLNLGKLAEQGTAAETSSPVQGDWVVVSQKDPFSGLTLGIARPIAQPLAEIRYAALRNLMVGLGMIGLALVGILPLSNRISRNVKTLSQGAEKLAAGHLDARVPVRSRDELGRLAETFNRMAEDLQQHQKQLVQQHRLQKELELCRHIQEEMLPKQSLRLPLAEVKGVSIPAREVGGDFFNYFPLETGELAILIGDVSGKGVAAALLMANIQATLKARLPLAHGLDALAADLDEEIGRQTPPQTYLTLFMAILDLQRGKLRWVNAGHNPQYALGRDGALTRLESGGRPLGLLPGGGFQQREANLREGDSLFLYTDGLTEADDGSGEEFGQRRLEDILARESQRDLNSLLNVVETAVRTHRRNSDPGDDATMVVLKFAGGSSKGEVGSIG